MSTQNFLLELGTEELPPKALLRLAQSFRKSFGEGLDNRNLSHDGIRLFATPRRLSLVVEALADQQPDRDVELYGPPVQAAFDKDGKPTRAAEGFARKCGTEVSQLQQVETDKGTKLMYRRHETGEAATKLLPEIAAQALDALPIPKRMRWGSSRIEFVRPAHWLVALYGTEIVPCELLGLSSGRTSRGHRFHHDQAIELAHADDYEKTLEEQGFIIPDFDKRRDMVRKQTKSAAEGVGGTAVIDDALLDEVTALVEWPVALIGGFDEDFLRLPQEALVSSMKEHQKYFHVTNSDGVMLPYFITISNIESQDPTQVIAGNERVIRPRLSDAAFFFDTDRKNSLADRVDKLKSIVFQTKLGSVFDKTQRVKGLAAELAQELDGNAEDAGRAALLSKTDLITHMVNEFPDLQGTIGQYYATHDGENEEVARAIYEQYLPRFAGDELPQTPAGCALAIADKLDTIVGLFGIGQPPTGDKDPFAIRRAALGILRIIVERELPIDLAECISLAKNQYSDFAENSSLEDQVLDFMLERFRAWFQDEDIPMDVFQAVYARRPTRPLDFKRRIYAVHQFAAQSDASALAAANKRVSNILSKLDKSIILTEVSNHLLQETSEQELASGVSAKATEIEPLLADGNYAAALISLAELRPTVDAFFDQVMVMAEDKALRNNRLALLQQLRALFLEVADISLLQSA